MTFKQYIPVEAAGGFCAGVIGTSLGFPLDTIKTRMQMNQKNNVSKGIVSVAKDIVKTEGFLGLYRGITAPLLSLTFLNTIVFTTYAELNLIFKDYKYMPYFAIGSLIGPVASVVSTVEHVVKTQLQLDNITTKRYKGSLHALSCIYKDYGMKGLYLGHGVNTLREMVFLGAYFGTYETLKYEISLLANENNERFVKSLAIPIAGGFSGAVGWTLSFPLDCVKANVQGQRLDNLNSGEKLKGSIEIGRNLLKTTGIRGLYNGVTPTIMRAFIVSATRFSAYEFAVWWLRTPDIST